MVVCCSCKCDKLIPADFVGSAGDKKTRSGACQPSVTARDVQNCFMELACIIITCLSSLFRSARRKHAVPLRKGKATEGSLGDGVYVNIRFSFSQEPVPVRPHRHNQGGTEGYLLIILYGREEWGRQRAAGHRYVLSKPNLRSPTPTCVRLENHRDGRPSGDGLEWQFSEAMNGRKLNNKVFWQM